MKSFSNISLSFINHLPRYLQPINIPLHLGATCTLDPGSRYFIVLSLNFFSLNVSEASIFYLICLIYMKQKQNTNCNKVSRLFRQYFRVHHLHLVSTNILHLPYFIQSFTLFRKTTYGDRFLCRTYYPNIGPFFSYIPLKYDNMFTNKTGCIKIQS